MHEMITLEDYLGGRRAELEKLRREIAALSRTNVPLKLEVYDGGFQLYSEDYHLAEKFRICKRSKYLGGYHGPDGGYSTNQYYSYPQFYFHAGRFPVYIQHKGFETDERIVIKSVTITDGSKDYSSESGTHNHYVDLAKVFEFFRSRGVKEPLLQRLERRIKEAEEL